MLWQMVFRKTYRKLLFQILLNNGCITTITKDEVTSLINESKLEVSVRMNNQSFNNCLRAKMQIFILILK